MATNEGTFKMPGNTTVVVIELCNHRVCRTGPDGQTASIPIGPVLQGAGPQIADVTAHVVVHDRPSGYAEVQVMIAKSPDPHNFGTPESIMADTPIDSTGYHVGDPHTTRKDFGLYSRFEIEVSKGDGGTTEHTCEVSVWIAIRYLT